MDNRNQVLNDAEEAMRISLDGRQANIWTALPGLVTAVDLARMVVSVQPSVQGIIEMENGQTQLVDLPVLINVPIVFPRAGGFTITLPIAVDDEVLVVFASRCIDGWWQSGGVQKPMEARMHDLSDGFAIPGPSSVPRAVENISATDVQIRTDDGSAYISIAPDGKIKLVAPGDVEITGNLKVIGDMEYDGDVVVSGSIEAGGDVVGGTDTVPISLTTHTHGGVSPGGSNTAPPNP